MTYQVYVSKISLGIIPVQHKHANTIIIKIPFNPIKHNIKYLMSKLLRWTFNWLHTNGYDVLAQWCTIFFQEKHLIIQIRHCVILSKY